ncbi:alpha-amylase family glycosyl hydrolase [Niveibacterium microcysteis]|uniref:Alpha-glucosidase C-terminal domain-containing protein n=1 Tax=Niveibacterium microcysteis TaxID=2811415 RepID=A0ABX7M9B6_9RHOO|nr:alpha-amylase family glycosyl hydrolase [Niveibacterium microcysteis]QSI77748.1 alpha-glucosidase C-terminal domain-containing protein [Niveibacterium microcysteis]
MRSELKRRILASCLALAGLAAWPVCAETPAAPAAKAPAAVAVPATVDGFSDVGPVPFAPVDSGLAPDWYKKGVFTEILVRAYQDSNGDGIGDLKGLTSRLDYLKSVGITGIWLMPIFRSSDHDHGYAVENYREIEPDYGTLADFDNLIAEAHKRGIGIIVDYVMNHSSADHKLFDASMKVKSPYRDWYVWAQPHPEGWTTFSGDPWREMGDWYYYAAFDAGMPDFNLRKQEVVDFHMNNLRFWLNRGVDGFRFDAVGVLYENGSIAWDNQPENHVLMNKVRQLLDQYGKRYMVCEAPSDPVPFAGENSCGSAFAFGLQKHIVHSVKMGRVMPDLLYTLQTFPVARMGTILSNHDWFAGARPWRQFNGDVKSYKMAAATLLTLPGMPFIYYGEEIGLGLSDESYHDDQKIRGPMAWDANQPFGGFTNSDSAFRPLVQNWKTNNVAAEDANPTSLLNWYRALIGLRDNEPALSVGSFKPISAQDEQIFAFEREYEGTRMLVLLNYAYRDGKLDLPAGFDASKWQTVFPAGGQLKVAPKKVKKGEAAKLELQMGTQEVMVLKAIK